jgi:hypothetical protein
MKLSERLEAQMPQNKLASAGMLCTYCDLGPCIINPFDDEPQVGACGIDAENMNYVNLGLKVIKGLSDYHVENNLSLSLDRILTTHTVQIRVADLLRASTPVLKASEELLNTWKSDQRKPRETECGIGVLKRDSANLVLTVYSPEMIKRARSQKMRTLAREKNAREINLVGALCGGAEASYNYGIPLLGGTDQIEEAADMIDYMYEGGDVTEACEKAVENFSQRDQAAFRHFTPKQCSIGHDIDKDKINDAIDTGLIKGVVAMLGCPSGRSTWNMEELAQELFENNFFVLNLSCILLEERGGSMMSEYNIPCVLNGGCCEPGKAVGLKNLTVLLPGWRESRLLTAAFAFASQNVPVILGTTPFIIPEVQNRFQDAGIRCETDSSRVMELLR